VIDRADVAAHSGLLDGMFAAEHDLLIVRGALPADDVAAAVARLDAIGDDAPWTNQVTPNDGVVQMRLLGESLTPNVGAPDGPPFAGYRAKADRVEEITATLPPSVAAWPDVLTDVLADLGGPAAAPAVDGRGNRYAGGTYRNLPTGCSIPVHVGNYFFDTGGYRLLREVLDTTVQLSFFFTLRPAEVGGELEVLDQRWGDPDTPWHDAYGIWDGDAIVAQRAAQRFKPRAGDLLIFDGGRHYHRVTEVGGAHARWTLGGFVGRTLAGELAFWN